MKKLVTAALAALLCLCMLAGCGDKTQKAHIYAPDGAPAIGLAKLMHDGMADTQFTVVAPNTIGGHVLNGDADIAIMPTNAAALLYGKGADIAMLGVTNFGSLYLVGVGETPDSLAALKGQVVYSIGQGNVPDLVFRYLLKSAGIEYVLSDIKQADKVSLAYVSEGTEIVGGLKTGAMQYGVVSEPAATMVAKQTNNTAQKLLSIQTLYESATGSTHGFPQAALVVKKSFLKNDADYVKNFTAAFKAGVAWAESEPDAALAAIKAAGSTAVGALNQSIAKGCNLGFTAAADCKEQLLAFFTALQEVAQTGETPVGKLPDDAFFLADPTAE